MLTSDPRGQSVEVPSQCAGKTADIHAANSRRRILTMPWLAVSTTVGELAIELDIPPYDALDEVIAEGVRIFWQEGTRFQTADALKQHLSRDYFGDSISEVEFDLTAVQVERLATKLDSDVPTSAEPLEAPNGGIPDDSAVAKPLRKFISSDSIRPGAAQTRKRLSG